MLHIWNSNRENLPRKGYHANVGPRTKRYLELDPMAAAPPCSPSKRAKLVNSVGDEEATKKKDPAGKVPNKPLEIEQRKLFTLSQVVMICEQKLRARRDELREEYERALGERLAEQYDTFIKFRHDQIERQRRGLPTYLS